MGLTVHFSHYNSGSRAADDDLRDLLNDIEHSWLGAWKGILLGSPCSAEDRHCLHEETAELAAQLNKIANTEVNRDKLEVDKSNLKGVYPVINNYLLTVSHY